LKSFRTAKFKTKIRIIFNRCFARESSCREGWSNLFNFPKEDGRGPKKNGQLDIDTPHIEGALIQQLMQDPNLTALVDEMCFEHHVYIPEMQKYWGVGADSPNTLATSYQYYTDLRNKGIRMHSWP
jgi:hypothetical protein